MEITVKQAVDTLTTALKADPSLFIAYQANIAMAIYDEWEPKFGAFSDPKPTQSEMHQIFNDGAIRFLNLLCEDRPTDGFFSQLDRLTALQNKIGYVNGEIHPVAFLGLLGEAGEVAEAATVMTPKAKRLVEKQFFPLTKHLQAFVDVAGSIDEIKKEIRNRPGSDLYMAIRPEQPEFDTELADLLYYLNAVAIGRGLTIQDLARMSYEKVIARRGVIKQGDPAK